jgi:REP element-mobilizing transposase RayT
LPRPEFAARFPVHVTVRMAKGVWGLRSRRSFRVLDRVFWAGGDRFGLRLVQYSVQGNHMHMLVEARGKRALSRGMQGLGVRVARGLNRMSGRRGRVLADHYHARVLRSPSEVRRVRAYLASNARRHFGLVGVDPFSGSMCEPATYLLRLLI